MVWHLKICVFQLSHTGFFRAQIWHVLMNVLYKMTQKISAHSDIIWPYFQKFQKPRFYYMVIMAKCFARFLCAQCARPVRSGRERWIDGPCSELTSIQRSRWIYLLKFLRPVTPRDLSRRVTVQRIVTVQRTRTSDKVLSTSDSITRRRTVSNFLWVRLVRDVYAKFISTVGSGNLSWSSGG